MEIKKIINFSLKNGLPFIFLSNVFNKIVQFCSSIILVHFIDKNTYGQWSYANNILALFMLFSGLGVANGLLQYISEANDDKKKLSYLKSSFLMGVLVNLIIALLIIFYCCFFTLPVDGAITYLKFLAPIPIMSIFIDIATIFLRATLRNKEFSFYSSANAFLGAVCTILGAILYGVYGVVIGRYISVVSVIFLGCIILRTEIRELKYVPLLSIEEWKKFIKYSFVCVSSNSISGLLYILDTFLIGLIIKDASIVAAYKSATIIPLAMDFIPASIIVFVYPFFAKENTNFVKFREHFRKLICCLGILNVSISVFLFIFAPLIIRIVFGENYMDSVVPFRILSFGFFISGTFRTPAGNLLCALKKVKVNLINSIICGVMNIGLDIFLILKMGANGAAVATVSIFIISGFISNGYMSYYLRNNIGNSIK